MDQAEPIGKAMSTAAEPRPLRPALASFEAIVRIALLVAAAAAALWFVVHAARAIAFPYPLDYGEGPLLDQARRLVHGQSIYRAHVTDYPFTVANYPPVYPLLLAALFAPLGVAFPVARALTFAAALASAALVFDIVRLRTRDLRAASIGAAALLASPYAVFWSTLVRVDFVALAFTLGALRVVVARPAARATPYVAAALVLLAALTRQSHLLAGPLAIAVGLARVGVVRAATFAGVLALLVGAAVLGLDGATHGGFLFDVVTANQNPFSFDLLALFWKDLAATSGTLVAVAVFAAVRVARRGPEGALLAAYLAGAAVSALTIGKIGAHVNYFLELVAALAIFAGLAVARAREETRALRLALPSVLLGAFACLSAFAVLRPGNMTQKLALRGEFDALLRVLDDERGPVLADEAMGMLPISGHPILVQPFEFAQLVHAGAWDQGRVLADVRAHAFPLVLVNDGPRTPASWPKERWTPELLAALHEEYVATGALADATLYRPRGRE